jgi:hypothetical protein
MSVQLSPILYMVGNRLMFWCPGCDNAHTIRINEAGALNYWSWDGCVNHPTIQPSILVNRDGLNPNVPICHSYVRDGYIQFLPDSSHKLTGLTVPIPDFPPESAVNF